MTKSWWLLGGGYRGFSMSAAFVIFGCFPIHATPATGAPEDSPIEAEAPRAATASHHASAVSSAIRWPGRCVPPLRRAVKMRAGSGSTGHGPHPRRPNRICCRDAAGLQPGKPRVHVIGTRQPDPQRQNGAETSTMDANDTTMSTGPVREARSGCLVEGCPCRDARIVSHRRARFFAHLAEVNGETAQRVIRPEPGWELPCNA